LADRSSGQLGPDLAVAQKQQQLQQQLQQQQQQQYRRTESGQDPYNQGRQQLTPSRSPPMDPRQQQQQQPQQQRQQLAITASAQQQQQTSQQPSPQQPVKESKPARKVSVSYRQAQQRTLSACKHCKFSRVSLATMDVVQPKKVAAVLTQQHHGDSLVSHLSRYCLLDRPARAGFADPSCPVCVRLPRLQSIWARFRSS
jgi:hypothetical protein